MNLQVKMRPVTLDQLVKNGPLLKLHHENQKNFNVITPPNEANAFALCFAQNVSLAQLALQNECAGLIITEKIKADVLQLIESQAFKYPTLFTTQNIHAAMVEVFPLFQFKSSINNQIHPTAVIASTAKIGANCIIEPYVVVGENVIIEDNCKIGAFTLFENESSLGESSTVSSHVHIGFNCHIGKHCVIGPHNVFGSDGFGFHTNSAGQHSKIPQLGNVIIGDRCEFGANCAIDRAALTSTIIGNGSKFDNFIHIAHNCTFGENTLATAGLIVAGSTHIGKNLTTSGGVHINGHVQITDNVTLSGRTGVVSTIDKPGVYGGYPKINHKESLKVMMSLSSLPRMRKQISAILKHIGLKESTSEKNDNQQQ